MQLKQAIDAAYQLFVTEDVPSPRLNAELLAMFVLGRDRSFLYAHPERELSSEEQYRYNEVVHERARGCPTQYITGHQEFWGLDLLVSPCVLIPRPETEHVVETALELVRSEYHDHQTHGIDTTPDCARMDTGRIRIVDVGTGSGCIALALASELPQAEIHACDISDDALEMARVNAARLGLGAHVLFRKSDLLDIYLPDTPEKRAQTQAFDVVVSNPPYVGEQEWDKVQRQVREFEPRMAVFSGREGLDIYRCLVPQAHAVLRSGGWFVVEIGFSTERQVKELLSPEAGWSDVQTTPDLQGIPRVVAAKKAVLP